MKKYYVILLCLSGVVTLHAQVGINTESPKTTLHIIPAKTDATTAEGIIAPNLTRAQLISKDARYGTDQNGAIIYITTVNGTVSTKTAKITEIGYYYFDGSLWQPFSSSTPVVPTEPWRVQGSTTEATANTQNIYQAGKVVIGAAQTGTAATETLYVSGTSNITGNSKVGSSTVVGAQTVGTTLGVAGATTLSSTLGVSGATTINNTGSFTLAGNGAGQGKYLVSDASGKGTWTTLPAYPTVPTEPWQVQGGTTAATTNAQNIYQTGSVGIGASTAVPTAYKFQVTGASNVTGNSRVASSTVVGDQTVGTTLGVTGATTLASTLDVTGVATMSSNLLVTGNTGMGITAPTQKLHVVGNEYVSGLGKFGGTTTLNASAQLELGDTNKGLLPNRVALTSATVKAPVTNAVDGMIVYNTATVSAQGLTPGFYYWKGTSWTRLVDNIPTNDLRVLNLTTGATSSAYDANNTDKGTRLPFNSAGYVEIPEDGSYAFSFRLYGNVTDRPTTGSMIFYYISLMVVRSPVTDLNAGYIGDSAEMDIVPGSNSTVASYSVTLGASLQKGDKIVFRLSHNPASPSPWALKSNTSSTSANRTSMVWWKL